MQVNVECYSGFRGDETPRSFWRGERKIAIMEIMKRWITPDHRYFKVKGDDEHLYTLCYDVISCEWDVHL